VSISNVDIYDSCPELSGITLGINYGSHVLVFLNVLSNISYRKNKKPLTFPSVFTNWHRRDMFPMFGVRRSWRELLLFDPVRLPHLSLI